MGAPINRMTKEEIVKAHLWRCPLPGHSRHSGIEHWTCYQKLAGVEEKVGYFDIECSNLKADFGIIFGYCILDSKTEEIDEAWITQRQLRDGVLDKVVVEQLIADLSKYDRVITHYGTRFDIPYSRARAEFWDLRFPEYGTIFHTDTFYMARRLLAISSRRLLKVHEHLFGESSKTKITSHHWIRALQGHVDSIKYIRDHCEIDVLELRDIYLRMLPYVKGGKRSV